MTSSYFVGITFVYLLNKFSWFKALEVDTHDPVRLIDFLIACVSDVLTCWHVFFYTFIHSLRSQPWLNLRHVPIIKCAAKRVKKRNPCSQNNAFCAEMRLRWFPYAFWTKAWEYKKLYTVTTIPCVPRFHVQTVRILYPIFRRLLLRPDDTDKSVSRGFFVRSCRPKHCFVEHSICRNVRDSSQELLRVQQAQLQRAAYRR